MGGGPVGRKLFFSTFRVFATEGAQSTAGSDGKSVPGRYLRADASGSKTAASTDIRPFPGFFNVFATGLPMRKV